VLTLEVVLALVATVEPSMVRLHSTVPLIPVKLNVKGYELLSLLV